MLDQRRAAAHPEDNREQLFSERYEALLTWALRLTHRDREAAEDLVQDAFVQFMLGRTPLEAIENIDGYLRRMLRYMHVSRISRAAQRLQDSALSVADYDSVRLGWTAIEPPRRMQASEELRQICAYACFRKETSRAGSILILRFFHDYVPSEIANLLNTSRHCVDQWQRLARREVKVFLSDPARLRFVAAKNTVASAWTRYHGSDCDLMLALRTMIFSSRQGTCLATDELRQIYGDGTAEALSTMKLAHIVSCGVCLDAVNSMLGLPLLAQRYPAGECDDEEPPSDVNGGGGSGGVPTKLPGRFQRQLRDTREHKPSELRIAVNGFVTSSLKISSELSEFDLNLNANEPLEYIEVASEQGVQLLFFSIDNQSESEQWAEIELSEERTLKVYVRTEARPRLHIVYNDPTLDQFCSNESLIRNSLSSPLSVVPRIAGPAAVKKRARQIADFLRSVFGGFANTKNANPTSFSSLGLLDQPVQPYRNRSWNSPLLATIALVAALLGGYLLYHSHLDVTPTATSLLERATMAETNRVRTAGQVAHQVTNVEIRRSSEGALIARQRIETWEDHERGQRIQRLYDEGGRALAVASQRSDGSRVVYHHHATDRRLGPATVDNLLLDLDEIWQLTPSTRDFNSLIGEKSTATVRATSTTYVVTYEQERIIGASRLLRATLTLARPGLLPIEQSLLVERGNELREYRFVRTSDELLPRKDAAPAVFDVESETAANNAHDRPRSSLSRNITAGPTSSLSTPAIASAELEIDVAYLLNQVKANRNEQVALTRSESGSLRVEGVVESAERRDEFLRALQPVSHNPAVRIQIWTVAEASKNDVQGKQSIREVEQTVEAVAVEDELRQYFLRRGQNNERVEDAISSYSSQVVNRAYRSLFHAIELKRLVTRFARTDMRAIAPDARAKWLTLLREQALAFARENAALKADLQPVFFAELPLNGVEDFSIENDVDLTRAVERLHQLALANNEAIRQAFTISSRSSAAAFKSAQFRRALGSAEKCSERIAQYAR